MQVIPEKDTFSVGDTIGLRFNAPNPVKMDDGTLLDITKCDLIGFALNFKKNADYPIWSHVGQIVEQANGSVGSNGYFRFASDVNFPLLNNTLHFVPQVSGWYQVYTSGVGSIKCKTKQYADDVGITFHTKFDVADRNLHLLDSFPEAKSSLKGYWEKEERDYFVFYVKP
jgi:hypothetical protein